MSDIVQPYKPSATIVAVGLCLSTVASVLTGVAIAVPTSVGWAVLFILLSLAGFVVLAVGIYRMARTADRLAVLARLLNRLPAVTTPEDRPTRPAGP